MAKIDESHKSAQEDELIVLQSIFCNGELKINKAAAAWNAWAPIDVCIKIVPTAHSNTFVSLTVHITCSDKYPAQPPQITFDHVEGVPAADVDELLKEMNDLCSERASEKMPAISEICELARDYLYQFNKKGPGDMNQTMLENNKKKETEKQMLNDLNRQREKAEIELENNSRLERLNAKKEEKERENRMKLVSLSEGNEDRGECFKVKALDDSTLTIYKSKNEAAPSRKLPHPDISEWIAHINEGELKRRALVTEWRFEFTLGRGKKQSPSGLMDLRKFESDLDEFVANTLRRLRSLDSIDQALYSYLFIHLIKRFTSPTNFKCSVLVGHNIDPQHRPLQMAIGEARTKWRIMLPIFASSAVCALKWIHDQHLYHGSIDHSSIWIHRNPDYTFKISDFFLVPSLLKLANDFAQITTPDDRKSLSPPVEAKESLKSAQQRDIAAVGVIMMDIHGESASDDLCTQFEELCLQGSVNADNLLDHEYLNRGFFDNLQMSKSNASDDPVGTYEFQKSSRLMSEWAMRTHLGGGGFGDVILAKNKVDGNDYAIKRIRLNRQSEQINRKITREAKIFSKLNHTNIVRYYNAWIEDVNVGGAGSTETDNSTRDALSDDSIIYRNAQDLKTTETTSEWTTSFRRVDDSRAGSGSSRSVSQIGFFANQPRAQVVFSPQLDASSGSEFDVLFVKSHDGGGDELTDEPTELDDMEASSLTLTQQNKVLYIQMEFCPRSTLRNLISSGDLYLQPKKVWRIFREILNGLQYIHHQGLVHRDIKPMNILLGVNDQVKIGDFGLATRGEVKKRKDDADSTLSPTSIETTRDVGTVFYMAPECDAGNMEKSDEPRTKIDVYSAGVVLFELFYSPLTGMERVDVLKSLRASLAFPDDYGSDLSREQTTTVQKLAKWMLQQKPENRPTVDQILASDQVPLVELEDNDFQKMFSQVIRNKKGSLRDWTMRNLFETATTSATNYLFDKALCEELAKTKNFAKHSYIEKIEDELSSCLKIHAFMPLTTQSLLPYSKTRTGSDTSPVKVMDESGFVFTLPPCLRKNFIRYCNHAQISRSKRYSFGKTFHRTDGGLHPIERLVCAVDVVGQTSTAELMAAEVLSIVTALTAELSCLSSLNWVLRVGHTMLVKSAMNHHGLTDEDLQKRVLAMLNDKLSKSSLTRVEKQNYLMHMCALSSEQASALLESLESSPKLSNVRASMRSVCKNKNNEVRDVAKGALQELDEIFKIFDVLCAERQAKEGTVVIDPSFCYEPDTFADGFVFQLEMTLPKVSGKHTSVPVMAGGRYDKTLAAERHSSNPPVTAPVSAIGFNLNVDILANIAAWVEKKNESIVAPCSVMVCSSESESDLSKEKYGLALQLRKKKIATDVLSEPVRFVEDLVEHCRNDGIANLLVVRDYCTVLLFTPIDAEKRNAGVQMSFEEALAKLSSGSGSQELASHHLAAVSTSQPVSCHSPLRQSSGATFSNVDLVFAIKMSHSAKKKLENQVRATTADFLLSFSAKRRITICVSELPTDAVRQLVGRIDRNFSVEELSAVFDHAGKMKQSGKMKQDFKLVFHELQPIFEDPGRCSEPIIIYSTDGFWKAIL